MVVHLPNFLVVRIVMLLEPLVPVLTRLLNVGLHSLVDVDAPLPLDEACLFRVYRASDLDSFACFGLRCECCGEVFGTLKWILVRLSDRHAGFSTHVLSSGTC